MSCSQNLLVFLCLLLAVFVSEINAQVSFYENGGTRGILPNVVDDGFGGGVAAVDFDMDGDIDMYLPQKLGFSDRLYRNNGNGEFEDISAQSGIDVNLAGRNALWFDYNDDHLIDLLITSDCFNTDDNNCTSTTSIRLYKQLPSGTFENVTQSVGLDNSKTAEFFGHRSGVCCGDIDNDGDLDLLVGQWEGELELYVNHNGHFTNEADARGIINPFEPFPNNAWQSVMVDFNGDGWLDIFTAVDFWENHLWMNQGDGTFVDVAAESGSDFAFNDMGVAVGDYDNDGDFDLYVTNIFEGSKHNLLLQNESTLESIQFEEVAREHGIENVGFAWGATWLDANNDTILDLAVTNGWFNGIGYADQSEFFVGATGPRKFINISDASGFNDNFFGSCLIAADFNRDGDLDLAQVCNPSLFEGPFSLYENELVHTEKTNWLVVRPRQAGVNHWSIGAIVTVEIGNKKLTRLIAAGTSIHGQEPAEAFFGLGNATVLDRVTVKWPMGDSTVWENVSAGQVFDAYDADLNVDGTVDLLDVMPLVDMIGPCKGDCQADFNNDGVVDMADIDVFVSALR